MPPNTEQRATAEDVAMVATLRSRALSLTLDDLRLQALPAGRSILAVLMETGVNGRRAYSLVAIADGTVSLYFSNGGGRIGAGEHEPVRTAAAAFLDLAQHFLPAAASCADTALPTDGNVKFFFVTTAGLLSYSAVEAELGEDRDRLTPLFYAGHAVLTEIRKLEEQPRQGGAA